MRLLFHPSLIIVVVVVVVVVVIVVVVVVVVTASIIPIDIFSLFIEFISQFFTRHVVSLAILTIEHEVHVGVGNKKILGI